MMRATDSAAFATLTDTLYTAAVADILDAMGRRYQIMHQRLRPLLPDRHACGFAGRARTFRWMEVDAEDLGQDPYGLEIDGMDALRPGDVVVHATDRAGEAAPWGELMTTVAKRNGAVGCVCDSNVRDCNRIVDMGFPVFYAGIRPSDSAGRIQVMALDVPVHCGDVRVCPGDIIFADFDGIVVIPADLLDEVLERAAEKRNAESTTRTALLEGRTLRDVYDEFGVL